MPPAIRPPPGSQGHGPESTFPEGRCVHEGPRSPPEELPRSPDAVDPLTPSPGGPRQRGRARGAARHWRRPCGCVAPPGAPRAVAGGAVSQHSCILGSPRHRPSRRSCGSGAGPKAPSAIGAGRVARAAACRGVWPAGPSASTHPLCAGETSPALAELLRQRSWAEAGPRRRRALPAPSVNRGATRGARHGPRAQHGPASRSSLAAAPRDDASAGVRPVLHRGPKPSRRLPAAGPGRRRCAPRAAQQREASISSGLGLGRLGAVRRCTLPSLRPRHFAIQSRAACGAVGRRVSPGPSSAPRSSWSSVRPEAPCAADSSGHRAGRGTPRALAGLCSPASLSPSGCAGGTWPSWRAAAAGLGRRRRRWHRLCNGWWAPPERGAEGRVGSRRGLWAAGRVVRSVAGGALSLMRRRRPSAGRGAVRGAPVARRRRCAGGARCGPRGSFALRRRGDRAERRRSGRHRDRDRGGRHRGSARRGAKEGGRRRRREPSPRLGPVGRWGGAAVL